MKPVIITSLLLAIAVSGCGKRAQDIPETRGNSGKAAAENLTPSGSESDVAVPANISTPDTSADKANQIMTDDLSLYSERALAVSKTLKDSALSEQMMESTQDMTNALAEVRKHLPSAKASPQEFSNRVYSVMPVEQGRFSFSFSRDGDVLKVKDVTKRDSENRLLFRIRFHGNGQVASFMKEDDVVFQLFEDAAVQSYAAVIDGKSFGAEWDRSGKLISQR